MPQAVISIAMHGAPLIFSGATSIETSWYHSFLRKLNHYPAAGPRSLPYLFIISDSSAALVGKLENCDSMFSFDSNSLFVPEDESDRCFSVLRLVINVNK